MKNNRPKKTKLKVVPTPGKVIQINAGRTYPGRNGNYCNSCGGAIDEGGHCNCGIDHNR
ncbi:MAG: hypothetical protein NTX82_01395 [Candidatus Parcubacteria bacterium]|nr:hypothetical protein [Candidatus Parcubacteria bacterium]